MIDFSEHLEVLSLPGLSVLCKIRGNTSIAQINRILIWYVYFGSLIFLDLGLVFDSVW